MEKPWFKHYQGGVDKKAFLISQDVEILIHNEAL